MRQLVRDNRELRMTSFYRLTALFLFAAGAASAQTPAPALPDTAVQDPDAVTAYSIRSGKLLLSSTAHPKPTALPDGTYINAADLILVILDGRITRVQESSDKVTEISSMRLNRQRLVMLTPSTTALMTVNDFTLPSGTFKSEDGKSSVTIEYGRPMAFVVTGGT